MEFISTEQQDAVAVVTIDHPPVNALSAGLLDELEAELERLDADESARAIVVRGAGEKAFVAGADISEFPALRDAGSSNGGSARGIQKLGGRMDAARTPFVAAIKLGLIPGGGGTQRLPRLVGAGRAMLLNAGGEPIDARTAYDWGLVERVVPREQLLDAALEIAGTFAKRSPYAVAILRELARTTRDLSLEEGLRREADAFRHCLASEDGQEGVAAFLEKREPQFTGR
jgi:enoyl-CoA hydratase/carnithine racemase